VLQKIYVVNTGGLEGAVFVISKTNSTLISTEPASQPSKRELSEESEGRPSKKTKE
jgi:hypothetical protein